MQNYINKFQREGMDGAEEGESFNESSSPISKEPVAGKGERKISIAESIGYKPDCDNHAPQTLASASAPTSIREGERLFTKKEMIDFAGYNYKRQGNNPQFFKEDNFIFWLEENPSPTPTVRELTKNEELQVDELITSLPENERKESQFENLREATEGLKKWIEHRMSLYPDNNLNLSQRGGYDAYLNVLNKIKELFPEATSSIEGEK